MWQDIQEYERSMRREAVRAVTSTSTTVSSWTASRRRAVYEALDALPPPRGIEIIEYPSGDLFHELLEVLTHAWSGSATTPPEDSMDWMLGPSSRGQWSDAGRLKKVRWFLRWLLIYGQRTSGTLLLVTRDSKGHINGVAQLTPYPEGTNGGVLGGLSSALHSTTTFLPLVLTRGLGPLMDGAFYSRATKVFPLTDERHKAAYPPGHPHLYIGPMGVAPGSQGKGYGSKMIKYANALADQLGWGAYLEASGPKAPAMFTAYGYVADTVSLEEGHRIACTKNEDGRCPEGQPPYELFFCMARGPHLKI